MKYNTIKGYRINYITKYVSGSKETNNLHFVKYSDIYDDFHKAYKVMKEAIESNKYYRVSIANDEILV